MNPVTILGLTAATCTTAAFLPQAIKAIKTKHTKDLSLGMYSIFVVGIFLWLLYGIFTKDLPIIAANIVSLIFSGVILGLKIKYG